MVPTYNHSTSKTTMNSNQVDACKASLLSSPPGTMVQNITGYGSEASHGDTMDWLVAWSLCCGLSPDEDVIEIVDDCLHYKRVTRYSASADFREKVHRLCLSLGIVSEADVGWEDTYEIGVANVVLSVPENFTWIIPDFEKVKQSNFGYEASKSSKRFDYAMNMRTMNNAYAHIKEMVVKFRSKDCSPWSRCLKGMRMCSSCGSAGYFIMQLDPTVREACVERLVEEGVVHEQWSYMMPMKCLNYIDEYA